MLSLWIGGYPATEIAAHTPPTWETLADGGCGAASWAFALSPRSQHQALRAGALVQIKCGPMPVYTGTLTEPDRSTWECHATGLSSGLHRILALDSAGEATRNLSTAITEAIATGGWKGTNPAPISGTAAGDVDSGPVTVGTLLDDYAEQTGQFWGVDGAGRLYMTPGPGGHSWVTAPNVAAFGATDEDVATRLVGRYDTGAGYASRIVGTPGLDDVVDLTGRGVLTAAAVDAILAGAIRLRGETKWVNGVTLHREQLQTRGGTPAFLASVVARQMIRAHGLASGVIAQTPWLDVVIGKTSYTAGASTIYLEPFNTAPRNLTDVIAAA